MLEGVLSRVLARKCVFSSGYRCHYIDILKSWCLSTFTMLRGCILECVSDSQALTRMCLLLKKKKLLLSLSCWSESFPKVFSVLTFCSKDTRALTFDSMCLLLKLHYTFCSKDIFCSKDTRALTFDSLCLLLKLLLLLNCWSERLSRQKSKRISFIGFSSPSGSCNKYIYIHTHTYVCMYVHTCCVLTNPPIRMYIHTCCVLTNLYIYINKTE